MYNQIRASSGSHISDLEFNYEKSMHAYECWWVFFEEVDTEYLIDFINEISHVDSCSEEKETWLLYFSID